MATTSPARKRAERTKRPDAQETQSHAAVLHLPHVGVPHVPAPHISMPTGTAGRVLWWGGLAGVAALGVVDWPVAALVAVGTWVAEQYAKQGRQPESGQEAKKS